MPSKPSSDGRVPITITPPVRRERPHVAIFSLAYNPFVGGAEVAVKEITDRLKDNFRFDCFTHRFDRAWDSHELLGGTMVHRLGEGGDGKESYYRQPFQKIRYVFRAWRAAEVMHKKDPFAIIWAIMASYGGFAALLFKLRHPRIPLLLTLQEGDSEAHILKRVGVWYPFWKLLFRKANGIQAISNYLADFAARHAHVLPQW